MSKTGYLLKKEEVDNFHINLTNQTHDSRLQSFKVPENSAKLTQIHSKTKFLCVHGYGQIERMACYCNPWKMNLISYAFCFCRCRNKGRI